jgi:integrase/recombinase XerD
MDTLTDFLRYLKDGRHVQYKTLVNYFAALSSFYTFLVFTHITPTNIVQPFMKRYLKRYKQSRDTPRRKLLTIDEMSQLVHSILDPRDQAIVVLLAKTGIRRGELLGIDVDDVNWQNNSILLKPARKRSNCTVFFDDECAVVIKRWLRLRAKLKPKTRALFVSYNTLRRVGRNVVYRVVTTSAAKVGFHDADSRKIEDHFSPHCCRHWFTTWLLHNGMQREYIKELRGDSRREAIDLYHHINKAKLREAFLAFIPKLGI